MDAAMRPANVLLSRLPEREYERLAPAFEPISVARREVIGQPGGFIEFVLFPLTAVAAVSVPLADGAQPAVATIGHEGLVGLPVLLGDERSPHLVSCCTPGTRYGSDRWTCSLRQRHSASLPRILRRTRRRGW